MEHFLCRCAAAVNILGFSESVFADDMVAFKGFLGQTLDALIYKAMQECQQSLHRWGQANSVVFDASKESLHILHRRHLVATTFDCRLCMDAAAHEAAVNASWWAQANLRTRRFHSLRELVGLYKSRVLSLWEFSTPAL